MTARSIIARHPRRADIEKAIRAGVAVRAVATLGWVSPNASREEEP